MDASERLIAESLFRHAGDAPSSDNLLAAVHDHLRRRRTRRAITLRGRTKSPR